MENQLIDVVKEELLRMSASAAKNIFLRADGCPPENLEMELSLATITILNVAERHLENILNDAATTAMMNEWYSDKRPVE